MRYLCRFQAVSMCIAQTTVHIGVMREHIIITEAFTIQGATTVTEAVLAAEIQPIQTMTEAQ